MTGLVIRLIFFTGMAVRGVIPEVVFSNQTVNKKYSRTKFFVSGTLFRIFLTRNANATPTCHSREKRESMSTVSLPLRERCK